MSIKGSSKEKRMYEKIKRKSKGRYGQRAKEVAARTVMAKALAKDHADRYALCIDFATALSRPQGVPTAPQPVPQAHTAPFDAAAERSADEHFHTRRLDRMTVLGTARAVQKRPAATGDHYANGDGGDDNSSDRRCHETRRRSGAREWSEAYRRNCIGDRSAFAIALPDTAESRFPRRVYRDRTAHVR